MFKAENDLERSLMAAATDPNQRPQFYRDLLDSTIYVITAGDESLDVESGATQRGCSIQMLSSQSDGEVWMPIFSSLTQLKRFLQTDSKYLQVEARTLFETTRGTNVVLNPNLECGKEFSSSEIESMLDGSIFRIAHDSVVEVETPILLGQPAEYPTELIDALSRLFLKHKNVRAAYLANIFIFERDESPHMIIGIEVNGDWNAIVGVAGMVAKEVMPKNEIVDFIHVSADDNRVTQYMLNETKPFYKQSFLRRIFG